MVASTSAGQIDPTLDPEKLPMENHPTISFAIPFPTPNQLPEREKDKLKVPPFLLYAPLAAPLSKPAEGEKEGLAHKAQRKWQEEERDAKSKGHGFKSKAVGLISKGMSATRNSRIEFLVRTPGKKQLREIRIFFPASCPSEDMKERFNLLIKSAKSGAIKNGVIATGMLPFVLAFDVLTFVTGPFEINAVWAASSWTGAARASAIANGVTSSKIPLSFVPSDALDTFSYRLHEICWAKAKPGLIPKPKWQGDTPPKRGAELSASILSILKDQLGDLNGIEVDKRLISEDLEHVMEKGAKEFLKTLT